MRTKIIIILFAVILSSCGTSTSITGAWKSDDFTPNDQHGKVFIAALTPATNVQNSLENSLAAAARERGIETAVSHQVFTKKFTKDNQPTKEEMLNTVKEQNATAIFTVTLKDQQSETRYVPGSTTYYTPMNYGYYGRFNSYYNTVYPMTYDPGYYTEDKVYYLESNLYDAETEELIWSAQSKTVNPGDVDSFARGYTKAMIKELIKDGVLIE